MHWLKRREYNNEDVDNSPNTVSDKIIFSSYDTWFNNLIYYYFQSFPIQF